MDAFGKCRGLEFAARVAPGFFQLGEDVHDGRQAELGGGVVARFDLPDLFAVADELGGGEVFVGEHFGNDGVGFGVHGAGVQRFAAAVDAQESGGLLIGFFAEARHFQEGFAVVEGAVLVAPGDDVLCECLV